MLAVALILQGGGALLPVKAPDPLRGWRTGAIATTMLGLFILAFGDGIQFIVVALALRSAVPMLAARGIDQVLTAPAGGRQLIEVPLPRGGPDRP